MPDFWDMGDDDDDDAPGEHGGAMLEEGSSVVPSNKNLGNYRYTPFYFYSPHLPDYHDFDAQTRNLQRLHPRSLPHRSSYRMGIMSKSI